MADQVSRQAVALAWATRNMTAQQWNNWCAKFVANAYGQDAFGYNTAAQGADALGVPRRMRNWTDAEAQAILAKTKIGDLVFFEPTADNEAGHVGIYKGNGMMVAAEPDGVREVAVLGSNYNKSRFRGTTSPPPSWKGRAATADIIEGAKQFQSVIERGNMPTPESYKAAAIKSEMDTIDKQIAAKQAELTKAQANIASKDQATRSAAARVVGETPSELAKLQEQRTKLAVDHGAALDAAAKVETKDDKYTPTTETGQRAEDIALQRSALALQQAQDEYNRIPEDRAEQKEAARIKLEAARVDNQRAEVALATARVQLDRARNPGSDRSPEQIASDRLKLQELTALVNSGVSLEQAQAQLAQTRASTAATTANTPSQAEIEARATTATAGAARATMLNQTQQIELEELQRAAAAGELSAERQARLRNLQAQADAARIEADRTARTSAEGGILDQRDQAALAQSQASTAQATANTLTPVEIEARQQISIANAAQENAKAAFAKREQDLVEKVRNGLDPAEALKQLGQFKDYISAQLQERQQKELERANAAREQQAREAENRARETENRSRAELAAELLSNAQGSAIFRNRGGNAGDPGRAATTFNPGGDPSKSPAERILSSFNLSFLQPIAAPAPIAAPQPNVAPSLLPGQVAPVAPAVPAPTAPIAPDAFTMQRQKEEADALTAQLWADSGLSGPSAIPLPGAFYTGRRGGV